MRSCWKEGVGESGSEPSTASNSSNNRIQQDNNKKNLCKSLTHSLTSIFISFEVLYRKWDFFSHSIDVFDMLSFLTHSITANEMNTRMKGDFISRACICFHSRSNGLAFKLFMVMVIRRICLGKHLIEIKLKVLKIEIWLNTKIHKNLGSNPIVKDFVESRYNLEFFGRIIIFFYEFFVKSPS